MLAKVFFTNHDFLPEPPSSASALRAPACAPAGVAGRDPVAEVLILHDLIEPILDEHFHIIEHAHYLAFQSGPPALTKKSLAYHL
jgi:hypothetical protein